ncbi:hypothetical protein [Dyadobacter sp. NIV53]|uniref:hypothetical protein n=1 Tax=Dyadobacter sp. NIV53 TaxID=2861765 RepID=UPI001C871121|nr:hypothetical protein [Dyadobacter sp. NIV53]
MKTLKNHLILFDAECPMCNMYTKAFVSSGLLDKNGRSSYQEFTNEACPMLDRQRAVNEIALINQESGEVTYGIESLFTIFASAVPALKFIFFNKIFIEIMAKVYAFVSYNRRVIIPAPAAVNNKVLQPAFKLNYRIAYLVFTCVITAYILSEYGKLMTGILPKAPAYREYLICAGQLFFQGMVISIISNVKKWDYLGNMMTISFAGALLLLPGLLIFSLFQLNPALPAVWFMIVVGLMFLEHLRRNRLLQLSWLLTISWILYRVIVLLFIFLYQ